MNTLNPEKAQGHWLLAKVGKRVLRPGGKELTAKLIEGLAITSEDDVVEFAPGMGWTAARLIEKNPKSYTGVDADEDVVGRLSGKWNGNNIYFVNANAANSTLKENSVDKVIGEAMLTMHAEHRKLEIIREAGRILKIGGLYGIHELGLKPDSLEEDVKAEISKELAKSIHVNARPLTVWEWRDLLKREGFKIKKVVTNEMLLLERNRIIEDEGILRTLKIGFNVMTQPKVKRRILHMRKIFRKNQQHLNAVMIIAEKV